MLTHVPFLSFFFSFLLGLVFSDMFGFFFLPCFVCICSGDIAVVYFSGLIPLVYSDLVYCFVDCFRGLAVVYFSGSTSMIFFSFIDGYDKFFAMLWVFNCFSFYGLFLCGIFFVEVKLLSFRLL